MAYEGGLSAVAGVAALLCASCMAPVDKELDRRPMNPYWL